MTWNMANFFKRVPIKIKPATISPPPPRISGFLPIAAPPATINVDIQYPEWSYLRSSWIITFKTLTIDTAGNVTLSGQPSPPPGRQPNDQPYNSTVSDYIAYLNVVKTQLKARITGAANTTVYTAMIISLCSGMAQLITAPTSSSDTTAITSGTQIIPNYVFGSISVAGGLVSAIAAAIKNSAEETYNSIAPMLAILKAAQAQIAANKEASDMLTAIQQAQRVSGVTLNTQPTAANTSSELRNAGTSDAIAAAVAELVPRS